jgi:hypothetical protein
MDSVGGGDSKAYSGGLLLPVLCGDLTTRDPNSPLAAEGSSGTSLSETEE